MRTRREVLRGLRVGLVLVPALGPIVSARAAAPSLPHPTSLREELRRALAARKALVVLVSLEGCPYCKLVRESYLVPLKAAGQPVVQLELAASVPLQDLQGRASSPVQVVREFEVRLAPPVLFLGRGGAEVADRLAGVASPDFYGAYLQDRVDAANRSAGR